MPQPRLQDDGQTVTLDLHGARVGEAERLVLNVVSKAYASGRSRVKIIHGTSTSHMLYRNRTIKHTIYDLLESGSLQQYVSSDWRTDGHTLLSLRISNRSDSKKLRLQDVF